MTRPIRLYLDTSDFAHMYRAESGTPEADVREHLKVLVQTGQVEIGLSENVFFELLQHADPQYREDRLRLLTELCGQNAFPCPTDLGKGHRFSKEGVWFECSALEVLDIDYFVRELRSAYAKRYQLNRQRRRALKGTFANWVLSNPSILRLLPYESWPMPVGREFLDDGDVSLRRYILGEISRTEANRVLRAHFCNPTVAYKIFEHSGGSNPTTERRDQIATSLVRAREEINEKLSYLENEVRQAPLENNVRKRIERNIKKLLSPHEIPQLVKLFGKESAFVIAQILFALQKENREIIKTKPSTVIDAIHALYLPHADLWRGDKDFSDLLRRYKVNYYERVVTTLRELPTRIKTEMARPNPMRVAPAAQTRDDGPHGAGNLGNVG